MINKIYIFGMAAGICAALAYTILSMDFLLGFQLMALMAFGIAVSYRSNRG